MKKASMLWILKGISLSLLGSFSMLFSLGATGQQPSAPPAGKDPLPYYTYAYYTYGTFRSPCCLIIHNRHEWDAQMAKAERNGELLVVPPEPAPNIDWGRYTVVLVTPGLVEWSKAKVMKAKLVGDEIDLDIEFTEFKGWFHNPYHVIYVDRAATAFVRKAHPNYYDPSKVSGSKGTTADSGPPWSMKTWAEIRANYR